MNNEHPPSNSPEIDQAALSVAEAIRQAKESPSIVTAQRLIDLAGETDSHSKKLRHLAADAWQVAQETLRKLPILSREQERELVVDARSYRIIPLGQPVTIDEAFRAALGGRSVLAPKIDDPKDQLLAVAEPHVCLEIANLEAASQATIVAVTRYDFELLKQLWQIFKRGAGSTEAYPFARPTAIYPDGRVVSAPRFGAVVISGGRVSQAYYHGTARLPFGHAILVPANAAPC